MSLLCISVAATIYSSGNRSIAEEFEVGTEVATLGLSLYQLGFGIGPLIWVCRLARSGLPGLSHQLLMIPSHRYRRTMAVE